MIKKCFAVLIFAMFLTLSSFTASADHELDQCGSSDAVCVGKVLLDKINKSGQNPTTLTVEFYNSDSCRESELLMSVAYGEDSHKNEAQCQRLSHLVEKSVWGLKSKGGKCINISDTDFLKACLQFI